MQINTRASAAALWFSIALTQTAWAAPPAPPASEAARKDEARKLFEAGRALDGKGDVPGALQQFLASREMFKTRGNTLNAAIALRKLGRLGEALDLFDAYLKDFDNLSPEDKAMVEGEISSTNQQVGKVEIETNTAAYVIVDDVVRGKTPLAAPLRLAAGAHTLRLQPEAFAARPVEMQVTVVAQRSLSLKPAFEELAHTGGLNIQASEAGSFDVLLDGEVVGTTPLSLQVVAGDHNVVLRGPDGTGSAPTLARVEPGKSAELNVGTRKLDAIVVLDTAPLHAALFVDDVPVGHGHWRGGLPRGQHEFRAEAPGYRPHTLRATLGGAEQSLLIELEKTSTEEVSGGSSGGGNVGGFAELDLGALLGLSGGSDMRGECTGTCSKSLPFGLRTSVRGGMTFNRRFELGAELTYLHLPEHVSDRADAVSVVGRGAANGVSHDSTLWNSAGMGALFGVRVGPEKVPITLRVAAGVLLGSLTDRRNGHFDLGGGAEIAQAARTTNAAMFFYVAPEARIGYAFNTHLSAGVGVRGTFAIDLATPRWDTRKPTVLERSGLAYWDAGTARGSAGERLTGPLKVLVDPSLYVRYDF